MKINRRVVLFLGKDLVGVRIAFLPNYPLVLSLLKHRSIGTFFNLKIRNQNRGSPLNNSIDYTVFVWCGSYRCAKLVLGSPNCTAVGTRKHYQSLCLSLAMDACGEQLDWLWLVS